MKAASFRDNESGMALVTTLMVMLLASALMVGFFATIMADQKANGIDRDQSQAYAAAHAGLEKLTSDLATKFETDFNPSAAEINALSTHPPIIPGFQYTAPGGTVGSGYLVSFTTNAQGNPAPLSTTGTPISAGPYAGFNGIITQYTITSTARSAGGAEVRLRRLLETVSVPVFQFGVFSETDLTFYAGENFNFGGRVQTNGNLFLSEVAGATLTLSDRVTAFKDVIRNNLSNGLTVSSVGFTGTVNVPTTIGPPAVYAALGTAQGSVVGMPGSAATTTPTSWTTISTGTYKSNIRSGLTGAKKLSLPLVAFGAQPIDLIRRPVVNEDTALPLIYTQRYFSQASLRILLSDSIAEIKNLPTIVQTTDPIPLDGTALAAQYGAPVKTPNHRSPLAQSPGLWSTAGAAGYQMTANGTGTYSASPAFSTVGVGAPIPAYFKIPATIVVGTNPAVVCTGRTATTFTGCSGFTVAITAGQILTVTGNVASGAGTVPATTSTTAAQAAIAVAGTNKILTVTSTAAFAPTSFWLSGPTLDGGAFTCSGYDTTPLLTGCLGLPSLPPNNTIISTGALEAAGTPLNRGFIKIELQNAAGNWVDVTAEILNLGISGPANNAPAACDPTPNAVIRLQHVRDNLGGVCIANDNSSTNANDYWPNVLYDSREGNYRDPTADSTDRTLTLGGMMNYVALDVGNLKRWLAGTIPAAGSSGPNVVNQNGFIVYFSDRRSNKDKTVVAAGVETGEYGFEDVVNPLSATGTPNGVLDGGEDVNAITPVAPAVYVPVLDIYGQTPVNPVGVAASVLGANARPWSTTTYQWVGMVNRPIFFRRALKLVNGANVNATTSNLPSPGLTVATENPLYVQGNYNATASNPPVPTETHMAASILADSVTLLSSSWNDANSFQSPNDKAGRPATTSSYRFAVVAGKGLSFTYPTTGSPMFLFGTDGGVGNFLRLLEDWLTTGQTIVYRGSIVSLFASRQAVGTFKCCERVYAYGLRNFVFDADFLVPSLLPPGTPMFRDVDTLTFRQLLRPNQ